MLCLIFLIIVILISIVFIIYDNCNKKRDYKHLENTILENTNFFRINCHNNPLICVFSLQIPNTPNINNALYTLKAKRNIKDSQVLSDYFELFDNIDKQLLCIKNISNDKHYKKYGVVYFIEHGIINIPVPTLDSDGNKVLSNKPLVEHLKEYFNSKDKVELILYHNSSNTNKLNLHTEYFNELIKYSVLLDKTYKHVLFTDNENMINHQNNYIKHWNDTLKNNNKKYLLFRNLDTNIYYNIFAVRSNNKQNYQSILTKKIWKLIFNKNNINNIPQVISKLPNSDYLTVGISTLSSIINNEHYYDIFKDKDSVTINTTWNIIEKEQDKPCENYNCPYKRRIIKTIPPKKNIEEFIFYSEENLEIINNKTYKYYYISQEDKKQKEEIIKLNTNMIVPKTNGNNYKTQIIPQEKLLITRSKPPIPKVFYL